MIFCNTENIIEIGLARKKGTQYSSTHPEFLQCKNYDRQKKDSCVLLTSATVVKGSIEKQGYKNRYLSANMDVSFPGPKQLRIEIPKDDECWRLTTKVQQAYMQLKNQIDLKMEDGQGPYRIAVFNDDDNVKDWKEKFREWDKQSSINGQYCYNLLRVGKRVFVKPRIQCISLDFVRIPATYPTLPKTMTQFISLVYIGK